MARNSNPAPETTDTIAVRVDIVVHIDPAQWAADAPAAEVDTEKVLAGLVAAGIPEDQAKVMAARVTEAPADANTPSAVRTAVREYVLAQVGGLEKLTTAKAKVVDRGAAEKAAAAAKAKATTPAAK
jgi:hypothetical protein